MFQDSDQPRDKAVIQIFGPSSNYSPSFPLLMIQLPAVNMDVSFSIAHVLP